MPIVNVAIISPGQSVEHDMPMTSARAIYEALDRKRYNPILVGVARDGKWWLQENPKNFPLHLESSGAQLVFLPGGGGKALVHRGNEDRLCCVDVAFPVLPEGHFEGLLQAALVPFVGSRLPAPALCMNKHIAKRILRDAGLPIARYVALTDREGMQFKSAQETLCSRSVFVKPATLHSSIGVSKVTCESEFQAALDLAFSYGSQVLIEEYVQARELECAILQNVDQPRKLFCSWPSEIIPTDDHSFFTYQAKLDGKGIIVKTKAQLDEAEADQVRALACEAFNVLGCESLARVDFLLRPDGELLINEVGCVPSLSPSGMFSRIMEESGTPYNVLIQRLLDDAIRRSERTRAIGVSSVSPSMGERKEAL